MDLLHLFLRQRELGAQLDVLLNLIRQCDSVEILPSNTSHSLLLIGMLLNVCFLAYSIDMSAKIINLHSERV